MNNKIYFPNFDGLRTIACLMVFFWHALQLGHLSTGFSAPFFQNLLVTFLNGKNGVSIFFVLSGFLITWLLLKEVEITGKLNLRNFYIRRILRIFPLYFLVILLIFVALPAANHFFHLMVVSPDVRPVYYFIFLSNFDVLRIFETGGTDFLPSTITWSVAIEEQFYLFWPLFFYLLPVNKVQYFLIAVIAGSFIFRLMSFEQFPHRLYFHPFGAAFDLSVGGAAAWLCIFNKKFRTFFAELANHWRILVLICGLVVMYLNIVVEKGLIPVFLRSLQVFFFAILIVDQCLNVFPVLKFSRSKWLSVLGKYTYGMYMLHPLFLLLLNTFCIRILNLRYDDFYTILIDVIIGLPLSIFGAKISYRFMEKKFLALKDNFSR